ncbi:MFS transporter [Desulfobacula sp.]|uniref:MFS transporter n=1 Tax=Desulfobacula sp. TaxID=2593537 RepID=UPI00261A7DCF|nr:MFS transporter [Desulfobacula sp.]
MKSRLIVNTVIILILALGFNAILTLNSLEKFYVESIASQYSVVGKDLKRNLERALSFGKSIKKFIGMEKILLETKNNLTKKVSKKDKPNIIDTSTAADVSVSIVLPDGKILFSTDENLVGIVLPVHGKINYEDTSEDSFAPPAYIKYKNTYVTHISIRDRKKNWVATAVIIFNQNQVKSIKKKIQKDNIKIISILIFCSVIFLFLIFSLIIPGGSNSKGLDAKFPKLKIQVIMFLVIGIAQIIFSGINTYSFRTYYLEINKQKTSQLTNMLKEDIEFFLNKNIHINKLVKIDVEMEKIITNSPELSDITIFDTKGEPLYWATKQGTNKQIAFSITNPDPKYNFRLELRKGEQIEGYISTNLLKKALTKKLIEIGLDSITVIVISFLFFGELIVLAFQFISRQTDRSLENKIHYKMIRPVAFLFLFCIDMSISFLPLHMEAIYDPLFGLSKTMVMGLPISMEMFASGIAVLFGGIWIDRRGWHEPFLWGLAIAFAGLIYSWKAPDALHFILSRGLVGFGYGLSLIATQGFVIINSDEKSKAQGLAQLFAGVYAGSICGAAMGAMLSERIGYQEVFLIAAYLLLFLIISILLFIRKNFIKQETIVSEQNGKVVSLSQIYHFFTNRSIFGLLLFGIIPSAIAMIGFINYFFPIYLNRLGTSQSNIGRLYMLFGLCLIYIAPAISRYMDASDSKKKYVFINGVLGSIAFLIYYFYGGMVVTAVAILFLSLSMCFDASRPYALKFKETHELGIGKSLSIFTFFEKIGQVIGPILFSVLFFAPDIRIAMTYLGAGYLLLTIVFIVVAKNDSKQPKNKHAVETGKS